ncbi:MAG: cyclic nucleotide-binding domain-containing protein [Anaerolineales bacterium]|nr:cyclic nucleotide-binding domain-containing protein [Anaerolineales bacterium]
MTMADQNDRVYVLREGKVALHVSVWSEGGRCGGETTLELALPGELFGWKAWMKSNFIQVTVRSLEQTSLVVLDLARLKDTQTFMNLSQRMLLALYAILQEHGLYPPSIQSVLELKHFLQGKGLE